MVSVGNVYSFHGSYGVLSDASCIAGGDMFSASSLNGKMSFWRSAQKESLARLTCADVCHSWSASSTLVSYCLSSGTEVEFVSSLDVLDASDSSSLESGWTVAAMRLICAVVLGFSAGLRSFPIVVSS